MPVLRMVVGMSLRKTRLVPAEPKVGRYRLFDWLPKGWRRCRACGARIRLDRQWGHEATEFRRYGCPETCASRAVCPAMPALEARVSFNLRARRSRKNRKHAQYQYATGGEPWRRK
jgi:hypothetical protein